MDRLRQIDAATTAFYRDFGLMLKAKDFVPEAIALHAPLAGLPVYRVGQGREYAGSLYEIARDDYEGVNFQIMEGEHLPIEENAVGYSGEANPCVTVLSTARDGNAYLLHLLEGKLTDFELQILSQSTSGIAGGGVALLRQYQEVFENGNIRVYLPDNPYDAFDPFSITVARRNVASDAGLNFPAGIYFGYSKIDERATEE